MTLKSFSGLGEKESCLLTEVVIFMLLAESFSTRIRSVRYNFATALDGFIPHRTVQSAGSSKTSAFDFEALYSEFDMFVMEPERTLIHRKSLNSRGEFLRRP